MSDRQLWEVNTSGQLVLHLHEGQARAWLSARRFIFMLAGTQGGKTSFEPLWLQREMLRRGPGDYLAVTATFPILKLKMLPEFLRLFRDTLGWGAWHGGDKVFTVYPDAARDIWGEGADKVESRIIFGSANNADSLESATAKAAVLDEAGQDRFRLAAWEAVLRRLSIHMGRVLAGTTIYNLGWLKQEIYDRWRKGDKNYQVIQFLSTANPMFPFAEMRRAQQTMPPWRFKMMYRGEYDKPENLIYGCYDDAYLDSAEGGNLVRPFPIPDDWERHGGIDPGGVHHAKLWIAENPKTHDLYVYKESMSGNKTTKEHAQEVIDSLDGAKRGRWWLGAGSEDQIRRDYGENGFRVNGPRIHDVEAGIGRVYACLKERRLYVFDTCTSLRDELGTYSREIDENGQITMRIKNKETFHFLDALRYACQGLYRGERWVVA